MVDLTAPSKTVLSPAHTTNQTFGEGISAPECDLIRNHKLSSKLAGPFRHARMANVVLAKLKWIGKDGQVIIEFVVNASKVML